MRLRRLVPRRLRQRLYDWRLTRERAGDDPRAAAITPDDFELRQSGVDEALDLVAVCRSPRVGKAPRSKQRGSGIGRRGAGSPQPG